ERFEKMLNACRSDLRGRTGYEGHPYPQADFLASLAQKLRQIDIAPLQAEGLSGKSLGKAVDAERLQVIRQAKSALETN
ncbi:MAG: multifunctional CCA tRNA nucleotidyl transferase/2'3'-cyclic phosphodiesterase/2'nucleotidase/phosphatase, partial [Pseudomonadota bacterium]